MAAALSFVERSACITCLPLDHEHSFPYVLTILDTMFPSMALSRVRGYGWELHEYFNVAKHEKRRNGTMQQALGTQDGNVWTITDRRGDNCVV